MLYNCKNRARIIQFFFN